MADKPPTTTRSAGWGFPMNAKKAHYFAEGNTMSLCARWLYTGLRDTNTGPSPDDCASCRGALRKLEALNA